MAHKKAGSTAKTNRDSISKRLGVKRFGGEKVGIGEIIIRQKGSKYGAGAGVKVGNDYTIFAAIEGKVEFKKRLGKTVVTIVSE
jgi:large subunit ribosomal protein L27